MTECNEQSWLFQELGSRKVEADFGGGYLSSDGGGLILREFEHHSGLLRDLAGCFVDYRNSLYNRAQCPGVGESAGLWSDPWL